MEKTKHYLNLTNGIEFLSFPEFKLKDYRFVRIQSTACERHLWDKIIRELDYNFLLDIALGYNVIVYDTSAKKKESRALYQGLKFIEFVLNKAWLDKEIDIKVKGQNVKEYFLKEYDKIERSTIKKIKYIKKYINTNEIKINSKCLPTTHDGDYEFYRNILINIDK